MNAAWRGRLVWLNCLLVAALAGVRLTTGALSFAEGGPLVAFGNDVLRAVTIPLFAVLAGVIVIRRPENILGPALSFLALLIAVEAAAEGYARYGFLYAPDRPPAAETAAWLQEWIWVFAQIPLLTLLFLFFPDGRLPSHRWRPLAFFVPVNLLLLAITLPLWPGPLDAPYGDVENPYGIEAAASVLEVLGLIGMTLLVPTVSLSAWAMLTRFRRSRGVERQQLKWFAIAATAALLLFGLSMAIYLRSGSSVVWDFWITASPAIVFLATAIAILRYRLYDIDRVINRTLVYGLLTAGLALIYFGLVVGLQALLRPLNGGSDLAIVLTTLVVAALFLPARRRVQNAVDRRFNRRAYNAARTIDAFSSRLREQIDLDTLRYELLSVVDETMQPAKASLWLRSQEVRQ